MTTWTSSGERLLPGLPPHASACCSAIMHIPRCACNAAHGVAHAALDTFHALLCLVVTVVHGVCSNSEMTPEEQKAAEEKKAMIEKAKARGREKAKLTKSMIIMDVKPWDDTTGGHLSALMLLWLLRLVLAITSANEDAYAGAMAWHATLRKTGLQMLQSTAQDARAGSSAGSCCEQTQGCCSSPCFHQDLFLRFINCADLAAMEAEVRAIHKDGLLWGTSRLMPVGFGIKKLQITAVIEDAKVQACFNFFRSCTHACTFNQSRVCEIGFARL